MLQLRSDIARWTARKTDRMIGRHAEIDRLVDGYSERHEPRLFQFGCFNSVFPPVNDFSKNTQKGLS